VSINKNSSLNDLYRLAAAGSASGKTTETRRGSRSSSDSSQQFSPIQDHLTNTVDQKEPIYLIGSGGHARSVLMAMKSSGRSCFGIFTNLVAHVGSSICGVEVKGLLDQVPQEALIHICIGGWKMKRDIMLQFPRARWATIIDISAYIDPFSTVGEGSYIGRNVIVEPMVEIGSHCIISSGCAIGHESVIGKFSLLGGSTTLAGKVRIGPFSHLGILSGCAPGVHLGSNVTLAAGVIARFHVKDGATVENHSVVVMEPSL
jgi:acetyltransferase-like isoleucine patch superfamily enzyme